MSGLNALIRSNNVVVLGDLNGRAGDEEIERVTGKYGAPERSASGERLLNMRVENELVVGKEVDR